MAPLAEALLLDAAGTLIRTREPPATVYARVAASHGIEADPQVVAPKLLSRLARHAPPRLAGVALAEIPELEREGWRELVREVLGDAAADGVCFDALYALYASAEPWQLAPGARQALLQIRERGVRLAVVSNMDARLPVLLEALGIAQVLDEIVVPSSCGLAKPDPRIFHTAVQRLGVRLERAVYIGDREENCVNAARAAGLRTLRYDPSALRSSGSRLAAWRDLARWLEL